MEVGETVPLLYSPSHMKDMEYYEFKEMSSTELHQRILARSYFLLNTREECYQFLIRNNNNEDLCKKGALNFQHELAREIALHFPPTCIHELEHCKLNQVITTYKNLHFFVDYAPVELIRDVYPSADTKFTSHLRSSYCHCRDGSLGVHDLIFHAFAKNKMHTFKYLLSCCNIVPVDVILNATYNHKHEYIEIIKKLCKLNLIRSAYENVIERGNKKFYEALLECEHCVDICFTFALHLLCPKLFESCDKKYVQDKMVVYKAREEKLDKSIVSSDISSFLCLITTTDVYIPPFQKFCKKSNDVHFLKSIFPHIQKIYEARDIYSGYINIDAFRYAVFEKKVEIARFLFTEICAQLIHVEVFIDYMKLDLNKGEKLKALYLAESKIYSSEGRYLISFLKQCLFLTELIPEWKKFTLNLSLESKFAIPITNFIVASILKNQEIAKVVLEMNSQFVRSVFFHPRIIKLEKSERGLFGDKSIYKRVHDILEKNIENLEEFFD